MSKKLTPQDQEIWNIFTKNVHRLENNRTVTHSSQKIINNDLNLPIPKVKATQKVIILHANDLRNMRLDGQIDLHGFTQISGEIALRQFLKDAVYKNWKWVRIITGKGSLIKPGVLREQTPIWLNSMPEFVTGYTCAAYDDGGTGALYVKIRRKSQAK
jgi:DNA-nicking Smr family endonuclease